jgi:hypothetical protein
MPCDPISNLESSTYLDSIQPDTQLDSYPKSCVKTVKKSTGKNLKGNVDINYKNKKVAHWVSRCARNKPKPCPYTENTIEISEGSDSKIERFLAEEYPYSYGLCPDKPYDYVTNLPPCLKENPDFPGIKLHDEPTCQMDDSPAINTISANTQSLQLHCNECRSWIDKYYKDVPLLLSRLKYLEDQVDSLMNENRRLQSIAQAKDKCQKTIGSVICKNVEATTTILNSKIT